MVRVMSFANWGGRLGILRWGGWRSSFLGDWFGFFREDVVHHHCSKDLVGDCESWAYLT